MFDFMEIIVAAVYFISSCILIAKAGEIESRAAIVFAPVTIHRLVFGQNRYFVIPFLLIILSFFNPWFLVGLVVWHIIFSISLARAYGETVLFGILVALLPGLGMIVLAFGKSDYVGPVDLFFFLR